MERTIQVTEHDFERLERLIELHGGGRLAEPCERLEGELAKARVVPPEQVPPDVVTMNSVVRFVDEETGQEREVTLVYPQEANVEQGKISILAPVGSALLGLAVGQAIEWPLPGGKTKHLRIKEIVYQPESAGDYSQ
jgi:regulator of nucleoside diphosphate kinase